MTDLAMLSVKPLAGAQLLFWGERRRAAARGAGAGMQEPSVGRCKEAEKRGTNKEAKTEVRRAPHQDNGGGDRG